MSRLAAALQDLRALDALALRDTALARRDPRAKLAVTLCFIVTVLSFGRYQVAALLPLALFPAVLSAQAQVPGRVLRRTLWLASPFALMVGLANPWFDRTPMLALGGLELSAGWLSFGSIVLRVTLTVSATVVLLGSTGMHALCVGLSHLGVPRVFTAQLLFLQRYLHVLAEEALRMGTAHRLRAAPGRRTRRGPAVPGCGVRTGIRQHERTPCRRRGPRLLDRNEPGPDHLGRRLVEGPQRTLARTLRKRHVQAVGEIGRTLLIKGECRLERALQFERQLGCRQQARQGQDDVRLVEAEART